MKVKIVGAGSAGIHLAQASVRHGWEVWLFDNDPRALERVHSIYRARYNCDLSDRIHLCDASIKLNDFDIIMIATPPDVRMKLALEAIKENPKLLHLEKPLCAPNLSGVDAFEIELEKHSDTIVTVGYDHAVSKSITRVVELLRQEKIGDIFSIDVEFREHWKGIFAAHPWLKGPQDSYLGYWNRGGGAGNEHSHALHLWLTLAMAAWRHMGGVSGVVAKVDIVMNSGAEYDQQARFVITVNRGFSGGVVQDVITNPPKKWARIQGTKGYIEWHCNAAKNFNFFNSDGDVVKWCYWHGESQSNSNVFATEYFDKERPDDFYYEIQHYDDLLGGRYQGESPLSYRSGLEVMKILSKAYYG